MQTYTTINQIREVLAQQRQQGHTIGFVPTLGNLHEGHMALIRAARAAADCVVASVFVNPMQFAANEDLDAYPRTLEADKEKLVAEGADFLFAPTAREMYPEGVSTQITIPVLSNILCGASRPGHFTGVATICAKLFNIIQPNVSMFGEKDYQQLTIIRHMVNDLCIPVSIVGVQTGRAEDGLALSSRNTYLTAEERQKAPEIYRSLITTKEAIKNGIRDYYQLEQAANKRLANAGFKPDYFHVLNRNSLETANSADRKLIILAAAQLGKARLIDNLQLDI
ncbi:MAG: pantoate--beta-alanine ligase [Pseudomonadales bacterium]|nr:pantoate--beta-alanine ligase [Pseudomonadales bacterium]